MFVFKLLIFSLYSSFYVLLSFTSTVTFAEEKKTAEKQNSTKVTTNATSKETVKSKDTTNEETPTNTDQKIPSQPRNVSAPISLDALHKSDLTHFFPKAELNPILAGPDDYLTLITPQKNANNKGVAILLPDWQQGATSQSALNFLRTTLPDQGWTTITIQPPMKPNNYPSSKLTVDEQKEENETTLKAYQQKLTALIKTVMEKATAYPGAIIVFAQGQHGALLMDLYQQGKNKVPNALILLSTFVDTNTAFIDSENEKFAQNIAESEFPILDLHLKYDRLLVTSKIKQHLTKAKQAMKVYYRQRELNNYQTGNYPEQTLIIELNNWLSAIGW